LRCANQFLVFAFLIFYFQTMYNMRFTTLLAVFWALTLGFVKAQTSPLRPLCGFDQLHQHALANDPEYLQNIQINEAKVQEMLNKGIYRRVGTHYIIPVVVHVIHTGGAIGTIYNPTDAAIINTINYMSNAFRNLTAPGASSDFEISFELAQRGPNCTTTTGINRVNGVTGLNAVTAGLGTTYNTSGIQAPGSGGPGVADATVKNLSRWSNVDYYNIWVVNRINGADGTSGSFIAGYAYFPGAAANVDGTVMLATQMAPGSITIVHELGHAFGLYHTFEGASGVGAANCPPNSNCNTQGDLVCDTDPHDENHFICSGTNPCTGTTYGTGAGQSAVLRNYMSYSTCQDRFTPGQRARARAQLEVGRAGLISSQAGLPVPSPLVSAASCSTTGSGTHGGLGVTRFTLETIDVTSGTSGGEAANYVNRTCNHSATLNTGTTYPFTVNTSLNAHKVRVYIDFNNNGTFDLPAEQVFAGNTTVSAGLASLTNNITIPVSGVVLNTPLRLRVVADWTGNPDPTPCSVTQGQGEDFSVTILGAACSITAITAGTQTACVSPANTYTQQVTVTYSNPPGSGNLVVNGQNFAIGSSPQTVTLTGLTANGASVNVTASFSAEPTCTFTVNNLFTAPASCAPVITLGAISPTTYCAGANISVPYTTSGTFNAGNVFTAQLSDASGSFAAPIATASGTSPISLTIPVGATTSTNYKVRVVSSNPVVNSAEATITINARPTLSGTLSVCVGGTTTLTPSIAGGTWSTSNAAVATVSGGVVTGVSNGTANITYTSPAGCQISASVTVNPNPTLSGTLSVCVGSTTTLTPSIAGGTWATSNAAVATVAGGVVTGVSNGSATITYTSPAGCQATANVTVNPNPTLSGTLSACVGAATVLTASIAGGTWTSSDNTIATVTDGIVIGMSAGTVTITYTAAGCQATANVTINPTPSLSGTLTACVGGTTTLTPNIPGGSWFSSHPSNATVTGGVVTGVNPGTTTITYSVGGCQTSEIVTINSCATPTASFSASPATVCVNQNVTVTDASTLATSWSWNFGVGASPATATGAGPHTVSYSSPGTKTISLEINGGASSTTQTVTVNANPTISGTTTVCVGSTTTLTGSIAGGTWSTSNASVATVSPSGVVTGVSGGTATITYTAGGCSGTTSVTVNPSPTVSGTTTVCVGSTTTLTGSIAGGTWSTSNAAVATVSASGVVTGVSGGSATITYTVGGCSGTASVLVNSCSVGACAWTGAVSSDWFTAGNWSCGSVPTCATDVVIPAGPTTMPIFTAGVANVNNITIAPGATLPALTVSGGIFNVCGNWTNSATTGHFVHTNGTVIFTGTTPQGIFGLNSFEHVTVNNGGNGVTLNNPTQVKGLLNLQGGNLTSNGNLTLTSTATQTAMVVNNGAFVVVGDATMQRHITPYGPRPLGLGYTYISSPTTSATISSALSDDMALVFNPAYKFNCWLYPAPLSSAPFPNVYKYSENLVTTGTDAACMNESFDKFETGWQSAAGGDNMTPGKGFIINIAGNTTLDVTGTLNNGNINFPVTKTDPGATNSGWNLIGNPYPAPIDWDLLYALNSGTVQAGIIRRVATATYSGIWAYYLANTPGSGTNGATNEIASMQGFFTRATANGNVQFNNTVRATSYTNPNFFRTDNYFDLMRLELRGAGVADETTIYFGGNTTDSYEETGDVWKVQMNSNPYPNLYTLAGEKPLAINGLGELNFDKIVPLHFFAPNTGKYSFKINHLNGFEGVEIYLEDKELGILHEIAKTPYVFNTEKGANESRFQIRFKPAEERARSIEAMLYPNPAESVVNLMLSKAIEADINIIDMLGRTVATVKSQTREVSLNVKDLPAGMYVMDIKTAEGVQSLKFVKE
jgi:uncharacterized protein YjdB